MKRKLLMILAVAAAGMLLTACASSDSTQKTGEQKEKVSQTVEGTGSEISVQGDSSNENVSGNEGSGSDNAEAAASQNIQVPEQGEPGYEEPVGDVIPDEDADAAEEVSDMWSGNYSDADESVSVQLQDDGNISFAFAQSGISGTAEVNGNQAVYHGDDYHVVLFTVSGNTLDVSVSSEEDFDASGSPLNGTYSR